MAELLSYTQVVGGSSPSAPTTVLGASRQSERKRDFLAGRPPFAAASGGKPE